MARVHTVVGDMGGLNAIRPVLRLAQAKQHVLSSIHLSATAAQQYIEGKLLDLPIADRTVAEPSSELLSEEWMPKPRQPDIILVGASQSIAGSQAAAPIIHYADNHDIPVILVEDMFGSAVPTLALAREQNCLPAITSVCVGDIFSRDYITRLFGSVADRVVITGAPQFDRVGQLRADWPEKRQRLRRQLAINDDEIAFLVTGQLNGTVEMLELIEAAIRWLALDDLLKIVLKTHPRATAKDQQEVKAYLQKAKPSTYIVPNLQGATVIEDLLPAADFVGSGYSTTNWYAVLCEMPGVAYFGTPALQADLVQEKKLKVPLEITAYQAAWYVSTVEELADAMGEVINGLGSRLDRYATTKQKIAAAHDGHATERVWKEVEKHLPS